MCQSVIRWGKVHGEGPVQAKSVDFFLGCYLFEEPWESLEVFQVGLYYNNQESLETYGMKGRNGMLCRLDHLNSNSVLRDLENYQSNRPWSPPLGNLLNK